MIPTKVPHADDAPTPGMTYAGMVESDDAVASLNIDDVIHGEEE